MSRQGISLEDYMRKISGNTQQWGIQMHDPKPQFMIPALNLQEGAPGRPLGSAANGVTGILVKQGTLPSTQDNSLPPRFDQSGSRMQAIGVRNEHSRLSQEDPEISNMILSSLSRSAAYSTNNHQPASALKLGVPTPSLLIPLSRSREFASAVWDGSQRIVTFTGSDRQSVGFEDFVSFRIEAPVYSKYLNSIAKVMLDQQHTKPYTILKGWKALKKAKTTLTQGPFNWVYYAMFETVPSTLLALKAALLVYQSSPDLCLNEFGIAFQDIKRALHAIEILDNIFEADQQNYNRLGKCDEGFWNPKPHLCILMLASQTMQDLLQPIDLETYSVPGQTRVTAELVLAQYCWWMADKPHLDVEFYRQDFLKQVPRKHFPFLQT